MNYYNEFDPFAASWLEALISDGLIPSGHVDRRSIAEVSPNDLDGYTQCHFFAGIGGWSLALKLAGWPTNEPVWSGSCPCQPFSTAGEGRGFDDERHLWPVWFRLIAKCRPSIVFGEQVAGSLGLAWLDSVFNDLEDAGYAAAAANLCASGVGAPHARQRLYFVADSQRIGQQRQGRCLHAVDSASNAFGQADWLVDAVQGGALPFLCGRHDGISSRVDALRGYGNAIVPQLAAEFVRAAA